VEAEGSCRKKESWRGPQEVYGTIKVGFQENVICIIGFSGRAGSTQNPRWRGHGAGGRYVVSFAWKRGGQNKRKGKSEDFF